MTLKDTIRVTARGYRTIHELIPGLLAVMAGQTLLSAALPFVNIVLSARILTALAAGAGLNPLLVLVGWTVGLNTLLALGSAGLTRLRGVLEARWWQMADQPINNKIERMDYERVEDAETHRNRQHLRTLRQTQGYGLPRLIWCFTGLLQGVTTTALALGLLGGAFTLAHTADAGPWSFLFTPAASVGMLALIAANIALSILFTSRSTKGALDAYGKFLPVNRKGAYYSTLVVNYHSGKDLKLYNLGRVLRREFEAINATTNHVMGLVQKVTGRYNALTAVSNTVATGLVYAYVALKALFGAFSVGSIVQVVGCLNQLNTGVSAIMDNLATLRVNAEALALTYDFIDMPDRKYHGTLPVEKRNDHEYEIEFRNVSFRYPGSDQWALQNLNLKLNIGQRMAVVGRNGSGKTTMIKLLCRLYDPTEGEILLNGIDIRKYDYEEYLSLFGVVFQDFGLFAFPLGQNVAASMEVDEARVTDALTKAGFGERLASMPRGLESPLYRDFDEDGVEISGGEAQKIAIARAIYKDAPFVVLDEPTAALDPISEFEIYSSFDHIVGDRTAVFISHRLSSCRFCDDIAVFDEGRLIQRGSHDTLLRDPKGVYHALWNAQAQYYTAG